MSYRRYLKKLESKDDTGIDKKALIRTIILVAVGILMVCFKYIAWTFPTNSLIRESLSNHTEVVFNSAWENYNETVIIVGNNELIFDVYNKASGNLFYSATKEEFFDGDLDESLGVLLDSAGYNEIYLFSHKISNLLQVIGGIWIIVSLLLYFSGKGISREQYSLASAETKHKVQQNAIELKNVYKSPRGRGL